MKYKIREETCWPGLEKKTTYREVEGEPLSIEGFEEIGLFIRDNLDEYIVSEIKTGMRIGRSYTTRYAAKRAVIRRFKKHGIEKVRELIANNLMPEASPDQ